MSYRKHIFIFTFSSLVATVLIPYALNDGQFFFTSENTSDENSELLRQVRYTSGSRYSYTYTYNYLSSVK